MNHPENPRSFLTARQVADRYGVGIATIWRWARTRRGFPQPLKLGENVTRWRLADLERWEVEAAA
ncbi:AlpA family transcriptional regulator [Halomonas sp. PR-M31]|uniref:helix-turn-helix transcriptional regulator n=1 Tax=Halomonas sp. PR-M31 TaxID=1471202 RepID=UPI000651FE63|nr:AlpA family phage regulatory protein [Halomonas sp. PR-M31]